jgi:hypothetical protein
MRVLEGLPLPVLSLPTAVHAAAETQDRPLRRW